MARRILHNKIVFVMIHVIVFFVMAWLTYIYPLWGDDLHNKFLFGSDDSILINSFSDVLRSVGHMYLTWCGRVPSHITIQTMMLLGKQVFNILNPIVFVTLAGIVYSGTHEKGDICNVHLIYIYLFIWFFAPAFGMPILMVTGGIEYMWTNTLAMLVFVFFFCKYKDLGKSYLLITMLVFFISGMCNENTSCTVVFAFIWYFAKKSIKKEKVERNRIILALSFFAGFLALMLAPGNYVRATQVQESGFIFFTFAFRFARVTYYMVKTLGIPIHY